VLLAACAWLPIGLAADPPRVQAVEAGASRLAPLPSQELQAIEAEMRVPSSTGVPRLSKVPGASPAVTIRRFLALTDKAEATIRRAILRGLATPGPFFPATVHREVDGAVSELQQATQALDLTEVPVALRPMTGVGTLLMLRSLLRYELSQRPDLQIPDGRAVDRAQLTSWTIPETTITLTALASDQASLGQACSRCSRGDFLFSSATLAQAPDDFAEIFGGNSKLRDRFGADLYNYWALLPGGALPPRLFLVQPAAVRRLLLTTVSGQSLLQWILLIPVTLLLLLAMIGWIRQLRLWQRQRGETAGVLPHLLGLLAVLPLLLAVWAWRWYAIDWINLFGAREAAVLVVVRLAQGLLQAVLAYLLAETAGQLLALRRCRSQAGALVLERRKGAGQILTIARLAGALAAAVVLIQTGQDLGLTSLTLLGLASVPALAISLGTQQLIRDIADGFSLLLDGQLRVGDRCTIATSKSGAIQGQIASLGMSSLRIRQDDGSIVAMPNSEVVGSIVTNHRFRTGSTLTLALPIAAEALPGVERLLAQAQQVLAECPELTDTSSDLEVTDTGWWLRLSGRWPSDLGPAEVRLAQQQLQLRLLQLTAPALPPRLGPEP